MKLSNIRLESIRDGYVRAVVDVDSIFYDEKKLWFEVPEEYKDWLSSDVYDAFLIAVLYPCMKHKDDIEIDRAMSKKLHRNLMNYAMKNIKDFSKELSVIEVNVRNYKIPDKRYHHVGTGFSGGVDSFSVINDRFALESDKEYKVDTFLCFNAGSHGDWDDSKTENKFWSRYEYLSSFPKEIGLPYIPLNTNVHAFMDEGHQQSGLTRNLSSVLSLQAAFDKYYYASTYSYWEEEFYGRKLFEVDLAEFAEPHLIQWLSTESITLIPEGGQYTRTEKTAKIVDYKYTQKYLNVCINSDVSNAENCSFCPKCCRTLIALDSMGELKKYDQVFDLDAWRKIKFSYLCEIRLMYGREPYATDNINFAISNGVKIPNYFVAVVVTVFTKGKRFIKFIKRKLRRQ